jgi:hypothetical protein
MTEAEMRRRVKERARKIRERIDLQVRRGADRGVEAAGVFLAARVRETINVPAPKRKLPGGGYRGITEALDAIVAEAAERFMRDPRSHGAPPHVPGRRTEAHPPKLRTDLRAKTDYRPKVRDGDDEEAQSFDPSSSHLSHH